MAGQVAFVHLGFVQQVKEVAFFHRGDLEQATRMLWPLSRLDYAKLSDPTIEIVEDALYFGIFGQERPAAHHRLRSALEQLNGSPVKQ
jgi:hypothetical protein